MKNLLNEQSGFRLKRLEMFNWGTFDGVIWSMIPDCQTAALIGKNGSGKSTIVDALLTLFVESRSRNYNVASGEGRKRERNERSYIRGQYSQSSDNGAGPQANYLRDVQSHSVLLAVFHNEALGKTVTLAQIFWIASGGPGITKRFYVAPCELSIEQHFPQRNIASGDLPHEVQIFKTFQDYIRSARKALGLQGRERALDLFNETVAVKDIVELDKFVRDHMLDKGQPEERVNALREQYRNLKDAHNEIIRATRQIEILTPLAESGESYRHYAAQIEQYENTKSVVPFYVAEQTKGLLAIAIAETEDKRAAAQSRQNTLDEQWTSLNNSQRDVEIAIANDSDGQLKRNIENQLPLLKEQKKLLQNAADRYNRLVQALTLPVYRDEEDFYENRAYARDQLPIVTHNIQRLDEERISSEVEQRSLITQGEDLNREIEFLRANPSNIPVYVARIRDEISVALQIPPEDLPFVGELLKIRKADVAWEGALERLLHSFALDLIVPDDVYQQVSRYVNDHNLHGRLIYHRVDSSQDMQSLTGQYDQPIAVLAYKKLELKQDTPYYEWLATQLMRRFAYVCCEEIAEFQQAERAITRQGQIKHSATRHEKDDRHQLSDRHHYVLGWDNRAKLRQLEREMDSLHRQITQLQAIREQHDAALHRNRADQDTLNNLLQYEQFEEIDWRGPQGEIDRLENQLAELQQRSKQLQLYEEQRKEIQAKIDVVKALYTSAANDISRFDDQLDAYKSQLTAAEQILVVVTTDEILLREQVEDILRKADKSRETLTNFEYRKQGLLDSLDRSIANFRTYSEAAKGEILDAMRNFRREYPAEGAALLADISSLTIFEERYHQLKQDDFPRYEKQFKDMLDRAVEYGVKSFQAYLEKKSRSIERSIAELNESLAQVDYGGGSTLRLLAEKTRNPEILVFQRTLQDCIANVGTNSPEELERAYTQIDDLITRLNDNPNWMRRVIDVRAWYTFTAKQIDTDGYELEHYTGASGKSGGQKAKFAYTILAAAVAYQYGLQDTLTSKNTFRLVVIDEAFSKLDADNAQFAMKLFEQLGLQLLVVTPQRELHVIEDYVGAYHYVYNNELGNASQLINLSRTEYQDRRRDLQAKGWDA